MDLDDAGKRFRFLIRDRETIYTSHFNAARPHRSLAQLAPAQAETRPPEPINLADYRIHRRPILDGITSEYQRTA
jgi:hypothetical protein